MPSRRTEAQIRYRFWRLMRRLAMITATLLVVGHVYASVSWERYFTHHCEPTTMQRDSDRSFALAWSCDNGKTYFP